MERRGPVPEPATIVVLGGTGDLMERKLLPALYRLSARGAVDHRPRILGVARRDLDDRGFRAWARDALRAAGVDGDAPLGRWCDACLFAHSLGSGGTGDYEGLAQRIAVLERGHNEPGNRVFYLALPPQAFPGAIEGLGRAGLNRGSGWTRLVVEKPFGSDLASARELNRLVHQHFDEPQVYRFANPIFESLWNRDRVESLQITVAEQEGIGDRGGSYEQAGALRDIVQNHLVQLLTLTAMEVPVTFEADAVRDEKVKVLRSIVPPDAGDAVLGQYAPGQVGDRQVPGYREEARVAPDSRTETFAALRLEIASWRWHGVPFYLRTGKRLVERLTQIAVTFRCPPVHIFGSAQGCAIHANMLVITIQPNEGFDLCFEMKAPGQPIALETQRLHFRYAEAFAPLPDAYETLLLDVLEGDQTLFVRADEVEAAWRLLTPVLDAPPPVHAYAAGSWGPTEASTLPARDGQQWIPG